jgi:hypothetical protein
MSMMQQHRILARYGLRKDFRDEVKNFPTTYNQYLKEASFGEPEIQATTIVGPNRLVQSGELSPVVYQEVITGPKVAAVDKTYKAGYFLSKEAIDDDKYGKLNQGSKWLGQAAMYTKEYAGVALVNDAFDGTTFKGMDNLSLLNTAHTLIGSAATVANRPTTAISLSVAGLTANLDLARKCKNENGDPMMVAPNVLMIANDQGQINKAYLLVGDAVYLSAANTVNKSTTAANYLGFIGYVVAGGSNSRRLEDAVGTAAAASGEVVLVQISGIARAIAGAAVTAGTNFNVVPSAAVAGRVILGTTADQRIGVPITTVTTAADEILVLIQRY